MTGQVPFETCQRGGMAKINKNPLPIIQLQIIYDTPFPPPFFNFFFLQWWPEQGLHGILFYYVVPKFTAYGFKRFNNKSIFQSQKKIDLVEIMSLNVMDEAVLRSPEWVSTGGPPVARSSCPPGPRSGRSYCTWLYSLNKKNVTSEKNHFSSSPPLP